MTKIIRAVKSYSKLLGYIHSSAWKEAYQDIFPEEFLEKDTPIIREKEFLIGCDDNSIDYYLMFVDEQCVGMMKTKKQSKYEIEIESIYLLHKYQGQGHGTHFINYIKMQEDIKQIVLWVLEVNKKARNFYQRNGFVFTGKCRTIFRGKEYTQLKYKFDI